MGKPIKEPTIHFLKPVYAAYIKKILADHPDWWGRYDKNTKVSNANIYAKEGNKVILQMSWRLWKEVVERFFYEAKYAIIQGETLKLGNGLGKIQACRIERNLDAPKINWGLTIKEKLQDMNGKLIMIYHTDADYCRIRWDKTGTLTNETSYQFTPANKNTVSGKGFKKDFINALNADARLKYKYKYFPRIVKKQPCSTPIAP